MFEHSPDMIFPSDDRTRPADDDRLAASIERDSKFDPLGIDEQFRENRETARADGYTIPDDSAYRFSDNDTSGADESREGLRRLFEVVLMGDAPFSRVYVKDQTRFGRWGDPRMHAHFEVVLATHGVEVRYCDEDTSGPPLSEGLTGENIGTAIRRVFGAIYAAEERKKLIRRVTGGMRDKVVEGFFPGAMAPFGTVRWLVDESTHEYVEPVPEGKRIRRDGCRYGLRWAEDGSLEVIRKIFRWLADGDSLRGVARRLTEEGYATPSGGDEWDDSSVASIARRPIYKGDLVWGRTTRDGEPVPHTEAKSHGDPPILYRDFMEDPPVSRELFAEVQEALESRAVYGRPAHRHYPLSSILTCAECGGAWYGYTSTKKEENRRRYYRHKQPGCDDCPHQYRYIRSSVIENEVLPHLVESFDDEKLDKHIVAELEKLEGRARGDEKRERAEKLRTAVEQNQRKLRRLREELMAAQTEQERQDLRDYRASLGRKIERLKSDLEEVESEAHAAEEARTRAPEVAALLADKMSLITRAEPDRMKQLLETVIERIELDLPNGRATVITRPL